MFTITDKDAYGPNTFGVKHGGGVTRVDAGHIALTVQDTLFLFPVAVTTYCGLLNDATNDCSEGDGRIYDVIPLGSHVTATTIAKVLEYINMFDGATPTTDTTQCVMTPAEAKFMDMSYKDVATLINAAKYLQIDVLQQLCAKKIAQIMREYGTNPLAAMFGCPREITDEDRRAIMADPAWIDSSTLRPRPTPNPTE